MRSWILRSIKVVMQMEVLRCKSPAMVRKEIWMHLLAYNLIRQVMAEAAAAAGIEPRQISFTGTLQTLTAFAMAGWGCPPERMADLYAMILKAVAMHRWGIDRTGSSRVPTSVDPERSGI